MKKTGRAIFLAVAAMLCCTFGTAFAAGAEPNSEDDFEFSVNDDFTEITITKYTGTRTDVVIPASIQDVPVVHIGSNAFSNNNRITSVVIPEGVKEIADGDAGYARGAFAGCGNLRSVTLPSGIYIGTSAFQHCWVLETVVLGKNSTIGKSAFYMMIPSRSALKRIDIPEGCTLRECAFYNCGKLEAVALPEGLKIIPKECFYGCEKLKDVNLPSTLKVIGRCAFWDCPLPSVDVPEGVMYIGDHAFRSDAFTSLSLPKSLKWVQTDLSEGDRGKHAFIYGDNIQSVSIPEGLELCVLDYVAGWANEDDPYELSSTAKGIIGGEAISKSIKLQKQLAAAKTTVFRASTYKSIRENEYMKLHEELLKAGLSEEETTAFFAENRWDRQ
ncbi:MAG: leucine-rich repeat domain-containing protein [Treponema sp.]|nr:leucine-rich repeat domain-containing protein [Treponema sp.]